MSQLFAFSEDPIWSTLLRFLVCLLVQTIIIRFIYYRYTRRERNIFSFFLMGIMIFLVCILLQHVEIQMGVALGLFAIFALLRFRSDGLALREMSYFFTVIGVSVINALADFYDPVRGIILINSIIIFSVLLLEKLYNKRTYCRVSLIYNRLELLDDSRKTELLSDISSRTSKKVEKVEIKKYDLVKNQAELEVFFRNTDFES